MDLKSVTYSKVKNLDRVSNGLTMLNIYLITFRGYQTREMVDACPVNYTIKRLISARGVWL